MRVNIEMTLTDQESKVWDDWYNQFGWEIGSVRDVFADRVIVKKDGVMYQYDYTLDDEGAVTFADDPVAVEYRPAEVAANQQNWLNELKDQVTNLFKSTEEVSVDKNKLVEGLMANEHCKLGQATLEKMEPDELQALQESLVEPEVPAEPVQPEPESAPAEEEIPAWAKALSDKVEQLTQTVQANVKKEASELVQQIAAHSDFTQEELEGKPVPELQKLHRIVVPAPADYAGLGLPVANLSQEWEDYRPPQAQANGGEQ